MFNNRIKRLIATTLAVIGNNVNPAMAHPTDARDFNERNAVREALAGYQHKGKGKGKRQMKPSGAAALRRAAKTRRNIRKRTKK